MTCCGSTAESRSPGCRPLDGALIEIDDVAQVEAVLDGVGGAEAGLDRRANAAVLERRLEELVLAADDPIGELLLQLPM